MNFADGIRQPVPGVVHYRNKKLYIEPWSVKLHISATFDDMRSELKSRGVVLGPLDDILVNDSASTWHESWPLLAVDSFSVHANGQRHRLEIRAPWWRWLYHPFPVRAIEPVPPIETVTKARYFLGLCDGMKFTVEDDANVSTTEQSQASMDTERPESDWRPVYREPDHWPAWRFIVIALINFVINKEHFFCTQSMQPEQAQKLRALSESLRRVHRPILRAQHTRTKVFRRQVEADVEESLKLLVQISDSKDDTPAAAEESKVEAANAGTLGAEVGEDGGQAAPGTASAKEGTRRKTTAVPQKAPAKKRKRSRKSKLTMRKRKSRETNAGLKDAD